MKISDYKPEERATVANTLFRDAISCSEPWKQSEKPVMFESIPSDVRKEIVIILEKKITSTKKAEQLYSLIPSSLHHPYIRTLIPFIAECLKVADNRYVNPEMFKGEEATNNKNIFEYNKIKPIPTMSIDEIF